MCWFHLHDLTSFLFVFFWLFMEKRTKSLTMGDGNFEHVIFRWIHRIHVFYCGTTSCYRSRKPKEIKSHPLVVGFFTHLFVFFCHWYYSTHPQWVGLFHKIIETTKKHPKNDPQSIYINDLGKKVSKNQNWWYKNFMVETDDQCDHQNPSK